MSISDIDRVSLWMRGRGTYDDTEHQNLHRIALAYTSDMAMARIVLNLYPDFVPGLVTSLDHSMWFHDSVKAEQWHLYRSEAEHSAQGKILNSERYLHAQIFNISIAQLLLHMYVHVHIRICARAHTHTH